MSSDSVNLSAIVGYCDELTAWRFISVAARAAADRHVDIEPAAFVVADDMLSWRGCATRDRRFVAPEGLSNEASAVWSIGASAFALVLGKAPFGRKGGPAQTKNTPLPVLRESMPRLSALVKRCLTFDPVARPGVDEIIAEADEACVECARRLSERSQIKPVAACSVKHTNMSDSFWPEKMTDTVIS